MKKTSTLQNGLIWFGAGVSIAEILTGTYFAPLGLTKGLLAILLGHVIGCTMFFLAGMIGGRTGLGAMETVELSFGGIGRRFFALLNILQLVGWTAIMVAEQIFWHETEYRSNFNVKYPEDHLKAGPGQN